MKIPYFLITLLMAIITACSFDETEFLKPVTKPSVSDGVSSTTFVASWQRIKSAKAYIVDVSSEENFSIFEPKYKGALLESKDALINNPDTFLLIENLSPNTKYYYRVKALIGDQQLAYSSTFTITTLKISTPVATKASRLSSRGFIANWDSVQGKSHYEITVAKDEEFKKIVDGFDDAIVDTAGIFINNFEPNTTYFYRVKAVSTNSISSSSNIIETKTLNLDAIVINKPTEISKTSFVANWSKLEGASSYLLDISTDPNFRTYLPTYLARETADTTFLVTSLSANTKYYYRLRSKTGEYISDYSDSMEVQTKELSPPTNLRAENIEFNSFTANWVSGDELTNTFYIDVAHDITFENILPDFNNLPVLGTKILVTELNPGSQYYFRVRGVGLNSTTAYSETKLVTTFLLNAPVPLGYENRKAFSFTAKWEPVDEATSYLFTLAQDPDFKEVISSYNQLPVLGTQLDIRVSSFDKPLYYRVQSIHHEFTSDFSETQLVSSVFTKGCRLDRLIFTDSEQRLQYDNLGRCKKVELYENGVLSLTTSLFYTNSELLPFKITYLSAEHSKTTLLERKNEQIIGLTNYTDGILETAESWIYDQAEKIVARIIYADIQKSNQLYRYDFSYDTSDRIVGVNKNGGFYRAYRYDDKLSPWALGHVPSFLFLKSALGEYCLFEHKNNITVEEFSDKQIVFNFDYNATDLAIKGLGLYNWNATFTNCDASK